MAAQHENHFSARCSPFERRASHRTHIFLQFIPQRGERRNILERLKLNSAFYVFAISIKGSSDCIERQVESLHAADKSGIRAIERRKRKIGWVRAVSALVSPCDKYFPLSMEAPNIGSTSISIIRAFDCEWRGRVWGPSIEEERENGVNIVERERAQKIGIS